MATDGLPHQVIHQHLGEAHSMREVAEKAWAAAEKRSAQLSAEAMQAEKAWAGSRERASKCMHAAHAASRAALVAMEHACAHDGASLAATEHACAHDGASLDEPEWLSRAAQEVSVVVSAAPEVSHRSADVEFRQKADGEFRHKAHHVAPPLPPPRPPHPETSPEASPEVSPETPAATAAEFRHTEAEEGHAGAESSAHLGAHELGLHARLSSAYAEAER
jgi:hypothetical protein